MYEKENYNYSSIRELFFIKTDQKKRSANPLADLNVGL